jgi:enoyl-CoA hydratase/carnithine racemase
MTLIDVERDRAVATVTVDNPPANAMGRDVLTALKDAAAELARDRGVRSVVLTGTGDKAFLAGADISEFQALLEGGTTDIAEFTRWSSSVFSAWQALPQPLIIAAQSSALGGGLEMALVGDVIYLDENARVGLPEVRLGLIPGGGGTQRLARRVGAANAKQLMFLGTALNAQDALALGLVDHVSAAGNALADARALAHKIAAMPAVAVQALKRCVDGAPTELAAGLEHERTAFLDVFASDDFREGYTAFLEKRKPEFSHR